ncbi:MAG: hypothetical protein ACOC5E_02170 [Acidobacteriota bacterium]
MTTDPGEVSGAPEVVVETPAIDWGDETDGSVAYSWRSRVENPNSRPVVVKVEMEFVDETGQVIHGDTASEYLEAGEVIELRQTGSLPESTLDRVTEAQGRPSARWGDEPYTIRTLSAFVDGLRTLEVFFVLEDWRGRPVTASGSVDLYVVECERLRAEFAGGGMQRRLTTLYARRFHVSTSDFGHRRIGFMDDNYAPPALSLGPIHYSIFDTEPRADEGLVRVVFRTDSGEEIVAEDRVFF